MLALAVNKAGFGEVDGGIARAPVPQKKHAGVSCPKSRPRRRRALSDTTRETPATVLDVVEPGTKVFMPAVNRTPHLLRRGGKSGSPPRTLVGGGQLWRITNTQSRAIPALHFLETETEAGNSAGRWSFSDFQCTSGPPGMRFNGIIRSPTFCTGRFTKRSVAMPPSGIGVTPES